MCIGVTCPVGVHRVIHGIIRRPHTWHGATGLLELAVSTHHTSELSCLLHGEFSVVILKKRNCFRGRDTEQTKSAESGGQMAKPRSLVSVVFLLQSSRTDFCDHEVCPLLYGGNCLNSAGIVVPGICRVQKYWREPDKYFSPPAHHTDADGNTKAPEAPALLCCRDLSWKNSCQDSIGCSLLCRTVFSRSSFLFSSKRFRLSSSSLSISCSIHLQCGHPGSWPEDSGLSLRGTPVTLSSAFS